MIHGFGKFWNIFSFFWRKILDAVLFGSVCHYAIIYFTGKETFDISGIIFFAALGLAFLSSIIHTVRIAIPTNKNKEIRVYNIEPDAVNVKNRMKSDVNVKADRGFKRVVKIMICIIVGTIILMIAKSKSGFDLKNHQGSWVPAAVLVVECVICNIYVCRPFRRCKCPICKRGKAIKFISKDLLESKNGNWTEQYEAMDFDSETRALYRVGTFGGKHYAGTEEVVTPVIRTKSTEYSNVNLGRYSKNYICRYCGQRFVYEDKDFEPTSSL